MATPFPTTAMCAGYAGTMGMTGVALALFGRPVEASDRTVVDLEDWQFVLGTGPTVEAFVMASLVELPDRDEAPASWQEWADRLGAAGLGSVFAFPVSLGERCIGALTFYDGAQRTLTPQDRIDGALCGDLVAATAGLAVSDDDPGPDPGLTLGCATGVLIARLHVDVFDAETRIRAYADDSGRPLRTVVEAVVTQDVGLTELVWAT